MQESFSLYETFRMKSNSRATFTQMFLNYTTLCSIHTLKYYEKSSTNEGFFCILGGILKVFSKILESLTSKIDVIVCL